jgi:lipopolysaccharide export system protein LptA
MKLLGLSIIGLLCIPVLCGERVLAAEPKPLESSENVTVITAERLTYDHKNHYALLEENVVVIDPQMQLTSDKLLVQFEPTEKPDQSGKVSAIKAEGHVKMVQEDKNAECAVASYDVTSGKIVLAGNPRVRRGRDILEGDVITFWRDQNKMICQPQARLVIYPDDRSNSKDLLLGE